MSDDNLLIWNNLKQVPPACVTAIAHGRLKGMADIKPQWRLQAITHQFGPCGLGWKYVVTNKWIEDASDLQKVAFVDIDLFIKVDGKWSDAIPGTGGSMLVAKEKKGLYTSDEAYKMATTDALSVAMKTIGVAADIYLGAYDGSKYADTTGITNAPVSKEEKQLGNMRNTVIGLIDEKNMNNNESKDFLTFTIKNYKDFKSLNIKELTDIAGNFDGYFNSFLDSVGKSYQGR